MKNRLITFALILILCLGLALLLYPSVSDYWNSLHQSQAIASYVEAVASIDTDKYKEIWDAAYAYNDELARQGNTWILSDEQRRNYERQLSVTENGAISYIEIPTINCNLPIYHGTSDAVLQVAIGHIDGSSLPTGGESTHCVLSGHRGLPSAQLFSRLDQLVVGDVFFIQTLDQTLTYEVDQILIVLPHEMDALFIEPGKDLCTLVTCTPYGVNSHRLLVRGHRIENIEQAESVRIVADAIQIEPLVVAPTVAIPMLLILLFILMVSTRKKR